MNKLNGWQRIGVVFSTLWFLLTTTLFGVLSGPKLTETDFRVLWSVATVELSEKRSGQDAPGGDLSQLPKEGGPWEKYAGQKPTRIQIDGVGTVEVGDEFKSMSPEAQSSFVAHIAEQAARGIKSSSQTQTGTFDDLIPKRGMSINELREAVVGYSLTTTIPIALLWVSGYAIAWIIAGFKKDRAQT